jgi:hypothetical protein
MNSAFFLSRIQLFSALGSVVLISILFYLIRRRKLQEEYSILWLVIFLLFLVAALYGELLDILSRFFGIYYPPATLFLLLIVGLFLLMLHFSIIISDLKRKINILSIKLANFEEQLESNRKSD